VVVGLRATTKQEAIDELVDLLVEKGEVAPGDRERVAQAVLERERSRSTGMEHGVALPHGAVDGLDDIAAALGVSSAGIEWKSLDKQPTHLVLLLAIPQNTLQVHVKTLAGIARLLNDDELRRKLRSATTSAEAYAAIKAGEEG
jgi:mannitol/fructose-specific phosphotransferase system IIA component (Ntr-type)